MPLRALSWRSYSLLFLCVAMNPLFSLALSSSLCPVFQPFSLHVHGSRDEDQSEANNAQQQQLFRCLRLFNDSAKKVRAAGGAVTTSFSVVSTILLCPSLSPSLSLPPSPTLFICLPLSLSLSFSPSLPRPLSFSLSLHLCYVSSTR